MTLKGLPRDNCITRSWHRQDCIAFQGESCQCMKKTELEVGSHQLLFNLLPSEEHMKNIFNLQSIWGLCLLWDKVGSFVEGHVRENTQSDINDLNQTMESLHIDDVSAAPEALSDDTVTLTAQVHENRDENAEQSADNNLQNQGTTNADNSSFDFPVFSVPPLLTRHPTPAVGKDDDKGKLREILQDVLQSLGRYPYSQHFDRILLAPDNKLSKNLIQLMKEESIFQQFLPEFPVLHLKKSKIMNLFSAYTDAGLHELLQYMKDEEHEKDWKKLITLQNIETAAKNIRRLSMSFHMAFLTAFLLSLPTDQRERLLRDKDTLSISTMKATWDSLYRNFLHMQSCRNATFSLHKDMMEHCDEIVAICLAERLGGPCGYDLMLSAVKGSLPFSFLNGATSYAAFCVELLHEHYTAGFFHQQLKTTLFTTPHHGSSVNIALDTQREMDHRDALKAFRPGTTLSSVIPKMAIVDTMTEISEARKIKLKGNVSADITERSIVSLNDTKGSAYSYQGMELTKKDLRHVLPTAELILRRNGLSNEENNIPYNVYMEHPRPLPEALLDRHSYEIGKYLAYKYCNIQGLFKVQDEQDIDAVEGCIELKRKLRKSKGVTIKRANVKKSNPEMSEKQKREKKREQSVRKHIKIVDCMSSDMNTCQAVVKPDCSKASVQKAMGMKNALLKVLSKCVSCTEEAAETLLKEKELLISNCQSLPKIVTENITSATVEFAGIKFKTTATSGHQYLQQVENSLIKSLQKQLPHLKRIIICEEKYHFTPDDFKAATRSNRQKKFVSGISHLKLGEDVVSAQKLSKPAIRETTMGRRLISSFLARNVCQLGLKNIVLDIDSEHLIEGCICQDDKLHCRCKTYARPKRAIFDNNGFQSEYFLDIKQRKGEAEMSQVDWLQDVQGESAISVVTSGDIDSVVIHLFAISQHWQRDTNGKFKKTVFVLLQKPKPDLYNITGILELMEDYFQEPSIGAQVSLSLCLGGNDFLPKFHGITHKKWINTILSMPGGLLGLLDINEGQMKLNANMYIQLVKNIYCPPGLESDKVSMDDVRHLSIKTPGKDPRHPNLWMPPETALQQLVKLIDCQIAYLHTVWDHDADLPDFYATGCLIKHSHGAIEYNLGPESHCDNVATILKKTDEEMRHVMRLARKERKKRPCPETPEKQDRKRPLASTPRGRRTLLPNLPGVSAISEDLSDIEPLDDTDLPQEMDSSL